MKRRGFGLWDALSYRFALRRWKKARSSARFDELDLLRKNRFRARQLRDELDQLVEIADNRLALPRIGSNTFTRPKGTDWSWRPQIWRGSLRQRGVVSIQSKTMIGDEVTLFHDCRFSELNLRQLRNQREQDLAPFGLSMDVFRFDGSFLSLAVDIPDDACAGLKKRHLIRLDTIIELEKPLEIFARLNIRHGPNTEQIVRELPLHQDDLAVEFDLAYTKLNEKRVERMWLDLIFEGPEMNQVTIRDMTFSRFPRADL